MLHCGKMSVAAEHANIELMVNENMQSHTTNKTPIMYVVGLGSPAEQEDLSDIALTTAAIWAMQQPAKMTGRSLLVD